MQITEGFQQLTGPFHNLFLLETLSAFQQILKVISLNVIHDGIENAFDGTVVGFLFRFDKVINLREILMIQFFENIDFLTKFLLCDGLLVATRL